MDQNLGQFKTQTVTHTPIGHNGADSTGDFRFRLSFQGHSPIIIQEEDCEECYAALGAWDARQDLAPLREFLKWQTEKTWEKQITRAEGRR